MPCVFCVRSHSTEDCSKFRTAFERKQVAASLKLCVRCLHRHRSSSCQSIRPCHYCADDHDRALCPLQPWNKEALCAFCLGEHRSRSCDTYGTSLDRMTVAKRKRICTTCLSRSHEAENCGSKYRCRECTGGHHPALCSKLNMEPEDTPPSTRGHNEAVSDEVRKLKQELASVKAERDETLRKVHKLEEDHGGCEAFKQAMQAGTQMSIANALQIADDQCTEATRARDEAQRQLEVERKRNDDLQAAANEAIRLTLDFQRWRFQRLRQRLVERKKATKVGPSLKGDSDNVAKKGAKRKSDPADKEVISPPSKRPSHSRPTGDDVECADVVEASDSMSLKLQLFMKANLRDKVTQEDLMEFIKQRGSSE